MMLHLKERLSKSVLTAFSVSVFHHAVVLILLTYCCEGLSQVIGPSQPVIVTVGDDIILPCHLKPATDAVGMTLEWARPDLNPRFVHVWHQHQDLQVNQHPSYKGRTSLSIEKLKHGDISLKLSKVKLSDNGKYRCYFPNMNEDSTVQLVVGTASSPVISLAGIDTSSSGVVLQCQSKGWYPKPEVFWLDGEGNLLSAGPTETVRGPDDLYTVSSRVTVEKRHNNNFTCRVQQNNINQTRETHIIVPDDFFKVQSSSSPVTLGLAVSLAPCIVLIVAVFFFGWKWRQNMIKTKTSRGDETEGGNKNGSKINVTEKQRLNEKGTDGDTAQLGRDEAAATRSLISPFKWQIIKKQTLQDEQQRRKEAEEDVQTLTEELKRKNQELEEKQDELLKEKQNREKAESEVTKLENQLESIEKQIQRLMNSHQESERELEAQHKKEIQRLMNSHQESERKLKAQYEESEKKQDELQKEKKKLELEVTDLNSRLSMKETEIEAKQDEIKKLQDENKKLQTDRGTKTDEIETPTNNYQESERKLKALHEKEIQTLKSNNEELERDD